MFVKKKEKMRGFIFLCILTCCAAIDPWEENSANVKNSPDPWDDDKKESEGMFKKSKDSDHTKKSFAEKPMPTTTCNNSTDDTFYKRILMLIVNKGVIQLDGFVDTTLQFQFPEDEFNLLKKYLHQTKTLEPNEYRKIDGILTYYVSNMSYFRLQAQRWTEEIQNWIYNHLVHILIFVLFIISIYLVYHTDWKTIYIKRMFISAIFIIQYIGETILAIKKSEHQDYKNFKDAVNECWLMFWKDDCITLYHSGISSFWDHVNPLTIIGNVFSKFIVNNMKVFYTFINELIDHIGDTIPLGKYLVKPFLHTFFIALFLILLVALIFNVILDRPFSINFGIFSFHLKEKSKSRKDDSDKYETLLNENPSGDRLSGDNLKKFLSLVHKNMEKVEQQSINEKPTLGTSSYQQEINVKPSISRSSYQKTNVEVNKNNDKHLMFHTNGCRRVNSLPRNLYKLGAGDSL